MTEFRSLGLQSVTRGFGYTVKLSYNDHSYNKLTVINKQLQPLGLVRHELKMKFYAYNEQHLSKSRICRTKKTSVMKILQLTNIISFLLLFQL